MGKGEGLKGFSKDITAFPNITCDTDRTAIMLRAVSRTFVQDCRYVTGVKVPSVNRRYTKEAPFLPRCI